MSKSNPIVVPMWMIILTQFDKGNDYPTKIAKATGITGAHVHGVLKHMHELGYVVKQPVKKRIVRYKVLPKGERVLCGMRLMFAEFKMEQGSHNWMVKNDAKTNVIIKRRI